MEIGRIQKRIQTKKKRKKLTVPASAPSFRGSSPHPHCLPSWKTNPKTLLLPCGKLSRTKNCCWCGRPRLRRRSARSSRPLTVWRQFHRSTTSRQIEKIEQPHGGPQRFARRSDLCRGRSRRPWRSRPWTRRASSSASRAIHSSSRTRSRIDELVLSP